MTFYLYRADTTNGNFSLDPPFSYFIYGKDAEQKVKDLYGINASRNLHKYETIRPLKLLDMSDVDTIQYLHSQATTVEEHTALNESFQLNSNKKGVMRNSETDRDAIVSKLICRLGEYDGYQAPEMKKRGNGKFHQEIMICKPSGKLKLLKSEPISAPPKMVGKYGKKPRVNSTPPSSHVIGGHTNNFSTPPSSPVRRGPLFG